MTRKFRMIVTSTTMIAMLTLASLANAQFSFGGGNIQFGGSRGSTPSVNVGRQIRQAVQQAWQAESSQREITDMRYRGPSIDLGKPGCEPQPIVGVPDRGCPRRCPQPEPGVQPPPNVEPTPGPPVEHELPVDADDRALQLTYEAQDAFRVQNYSLATETMDQVLELSPESAAAFQFRALTHFAQGNYDAAAADVYDTLLRGPIWDWETVYPLYGNQYPYTNQYRALSRAAKEDATSMSKHFLLAYHHLLLGHLEHGERELQKVLVIQPDEPVTQKLLGVVRELRAADAVASR